MEEKRTKELVPFPLDQKRRLELGQELALLNRRRVNIEVDRSATTAQFNADLKLINKDIDRVSLALENGIEEKEAEVMAMLNAPEPGKKSILSVSDNRVIRIESMSPAEMQDEFPFGETTEGPTGSE